LQEAINVTIAEFQSLITDKPILDHEVQSAKQNLIGGLLLELEDSQSLAGWHGMKQLLEQKVETEEDVIARVEAVTLADAQAVAREIIKPDTMRFALIGPFREGDITVPEIK
jgi:predicted Zn-dependent peptidase